MKIIGNIYSNHALFNIIIISVQLMKFQYNSNLLDLYYKVS